MSGPPKNNIRKLSFLSFGRNNGSNDGSNGGNNTEVRLDDEMDKVFSMSGDVSEDRFDVAKLHGTPESAPTGTPNFGERDYSLHRKKSYPHIHVPLKAISSRSMRRRLTSPQISETTTDTPSSDPGSPFHDISDSGTVGPLSSTATAGDAPDGDEDEDTAALSSDTEAPVSDPAAFMTPGAQQNLPMDEGSVHGSPDKRVQFTIGAIANIPEDETQNHVQEAGDDKKHRKNRYHHGHHSKFRKYSLQEDPGWRKRSGSEHSSRNGSRRVSIQPEDATLEEADIDDLTSHRSDEPRVVRRHMASKSGSVVRIGRKDGGETLLQNVLSPQAFKKMYDHSPHAVFVQLDELMGLGEEREWKETARWIKYEEDVEEGSDRWGRPHVASLSFHSLLNLRRCLETGVVLLDLEERDLPGVAYRISEQMVVDELIQESDKPMIMRALLLRHRHVNEHERGFRFARRHNSSYASLQSLWGGTDDGTDLGQRMFGRSSVCSAHSLRCPSPYAQHRAPHNLHDAEKRKTSFPLESLAKNGAPNCDAEGRLLVPMDNHTIVDIKEETYTSSNEDLKRAQNETILKRIPTGAEATTVLVGAVDFLEQPTIAFVRLAEGIFMPNITEVSIPVRFLFILLGPITADLDYHEIGRSISTLMANHQFHKIAYKADDRKALLSAINEFLDDSIVLPPGDWEKQTLLQFDELKAKNEHIKKRKLKAIRDKGGVTDETAKSLLVAEDGKKPPFPDPLKRTRRPFGGLINDLKRRFPFYKSDIVEGFNAQCAAAAIFMYFAALSGAITFGGLMSDKTQNQIGISETLVATSVAGIVFALFAGQPLVIVGSTGPLLLFDESLFEFCKSNNVEYLTTRIYIGIWMGVIALIVACFEGSVFVKLFTRFTEEIFSALISLLYIVESMMKLFFVYGRHPLLANYCDLVVASLVATNNSSNVTSDINDTMYSSTDTDIGIGTDYDGMLMDEAVENYNSTTTAMPLMNDTIKPIIVGEQYTGPVNQPNTALFCTILSLGTFAIAYYLRLFRNSKFLGRNARRALGDFGVPIAIVIMVALDYLVPETYTEKLRVPSGLSPSNPIFRGWLINPSGMEQPFQLWLGFAAVIPAMLVYILVFMETHIAELIIDKKERKLRKGSGFHLDIVLICLINIGCGFLGTPWICAATVRSVAHVSAVTVMSRTHAPGEKPHLVEVKEQRVSALTVSVLVGISVLMSPLLRMVPMAVLFGVFLYMGISSMEGIQFFERIKLFFMPVKHHPSTSYVKRVQTYKMHLFTFIQLMCLVLLWIVKSTRASLAFPFFLLLMVPLRAQMTHLFTPAELRALDGEQPDVDDDEPDFYAEAPLPG